MSRISKTKIVNTKTESYDSSPSRGGHQGLAGILEDMHRRLNDGFSPHVHADFIGHALNVAAIVAVTDIKGDITYVNSKFCEISGYSESELIGFNHRMLKTGKHPTAFFRTMYRQIARGEAWHGEICNRRKDGSLYWVDTTIVPHMAENGKPDSYTSIRFDITARKEMEEELRTSKERLNYIANHDALTGLPNRRFFQNFIEGLVTQCSRSGENFSLALIDIDTFKEINDSFGHLTGDELLRIVGERLSRMTDDRMFVSRFAGDEFGLIFSGSEADGVRLFEAILEDMRQPIKVQGTLRRYSVSMGVAFFPEHGDNGERLLRAADLALYQAKSLGRDRLNVVTPALIDQSNRKAYMLEEIERSLLDGSLEMHYQPIVPLSDDCPVSLEALMRWQHSERGLLSPGNFQDAFADPSLRAALGMFMLERVFRDMATLRNQNTPINRVGINLTNSDFRSDQFIDRFFELFDETGIGPDHFCVEVTEGVLLGSHQKRVEDGLRRLHDAGVEVALDDFGTGFASLAHLRQLPLNRIKIDRSFITNMVCSPEDRAIVRGIIQITHSLGKVVTAEGVETAEQVEMLVGMKCDFLQGWYFGKACEVKNLPSLLLTMPAIPRR